MSVDSSDPAVWIWTEPANQFSSDVFKYIKNIIQDKELIPLHLSSEYAVMESQLLPEYALKLCQQFGLLENERTTFFSYKDHLLALELCISRLTQTKDGTVEKQRVMSCHSSYVNQCMSFDQDEIMDDDDRSAVLSYKEFLKHSNCADQWSLLGLITELTEATNNDWIELRKKTSFLVVGPIETDVTKKLLEVLSGSDKVFKLSSESPLNSSLEGSPSSRSGVKTSSVSFERQLTTFGDVMAKSGSQLYCVSATEEYAEDVMLAFLSLLVNCRNELALSKAIISPLIDLGHQAFTDIKHLSLQKEMPMCQTVISYVTRVRLGGKGYAPPADCPLKQHLKGLEQFVDLLNQLQTVVEEDASTESAVKRAINILKNKLIRCSSNKLRKSSIEEVAKNLTKDVLEIIQINSEIISEEKSSQIGHKAFTALYRLVNQRSSIFDTSNSEDFPEVKTTDKTPLNLPPLLGYFRSPEDSRTNDDSQMSSNHSLKVEDTNDSLSVVSYFHSNDSCSTQKSCLEAKTPTKLSFEGIFEDKVKSTSNNICQTEKEITKKTLSNKPGAKRSILRDISNEKAAKRANTKASKSKKGAAKQKSQIKGQGQITKFLIRA